MLETRQASSQLCGKKKVNYQVIANAHVFQVGRLTLMTTWNVTQGVLGYVETITCQSMISTTGF